MAMLEDRDGTLWFATLGNGLIRDCSTSEYMRLVQCKDRLQRAGALIERVDYECAVHA